MSEKEFQRIVIRLLRESGWLVCHFSDSRRQVKPGVFVGDVDARGFPDLVAVKHSRVLFVELKSEKGVLSKDQKIWLDALVKSGAEVFVWRPSHFDSIVRVLNRKCFGEQFGSWVVS